ncbi:RE1-silencing transcription factor [Myotis brandtii]|uniref:RE1-silencing transcription factor n=1 Tax=Myotis brandtii TaxID=109478 RepID=S7ME58_MYOBR|nr:RE1-silencing transcription factor [Myotis brandtii]
MEDGPRPTPVPTAALGPTVPFKLVKKANAELMPVGDNNFPDSDGEGLEESPEIKGKPNGLENMELESLELSVAELQPVFEVSAAPEIYSSNKELPPETPGPLRPNPFVVSHANMKQNLKTVCASHQSS